MNDRQPLLGNTPEEITAASDAMAALDRVRFYYASPGLPAVPEDFEASAAARKIASINRSAAALRGVARTLAKHNDRHNRQREEKLTKAKAVLAEAIQRNTGDTKP